MARRLAAALLVPAALAAGLAVPALAGSKRAPKKTVGVVDYSFTPARMNVRAGTKIVWKWNAANSAPHDVKLVSAPRGVRKFTSPTATAGITYARTFTKPGTYRLLCTYHAAVMRETIVVRGR